MAFLLNVKTLIARTENSVKVHPQIPLKLYTVLCFRLSREVVVSYYIWMTTSSANGSAYFFSVSPQHNTLTTFLEYTKNMSLFQHQYNKTQI